jgi:hypothetical protein
VASVINMLTLCTKLKSLHCRIQELMFPFDVVLALSLNVGSILCTLKTPHFSKIYVRERTNIYRVGHKSLDTSNLPLHRVA